MGKGIKTDETITNIHLDIYFDDYKIKEIRCPILDIHAKDDPLAKYETLEKFILATKVKTYIFETGGHLITGHSDPISTNIKDFIAVTKAQPIQP